MEDVGSDGSDEEEKDREKGSEVRPPTSAEGTSGLVGVQDPRHPDDEIGVPRR